MSNIPWILYPGTVFPPTCIKYANFSVLDADKSVVLIMVFSVVGMFNYFPDVFQYSFVNRYRAKSIKAKAICLHFKSTPNNATVHHSSIILYIAVLEVTVHQPQSGRQRSAAECEQLQWRTGNHHNGGRLRWRLGYGWRVLRGWVIDSLCLCFALLGTNVCDARFDSAAGITM